MQAAPRIAGHALAASAFFFCFQYFGFAQTLETSLIWAIMGGAAAGFLAWLQQRRGGSV